MGDGLKASALFLMSIGVLFFAGEFPGFLAVGASCRVSTEEATTATTGEFCGSSRDRSGTSDSSLGWCMVMVGGVRRSTANRQYFPLN